jgi:hypothetical protein
MKILFVGLKLSTEADRALVVDAITNGRKVLSGGIASASRTHLSHARRDGETRVV